MDIRDQKFAWNFVGSLLIIVGLAVIGVALYALFGPKGGVEPPSYYLGLAAAIVLLLMFGAALIIYGVLGFIELRRLERGEKPLFR